MSARQMPAAVKRIFTESFTVKDVAEPLASFDATAPASEVRAMMEQKSVEVVGVRREGQVTGFVQRASLGDRTCGEHQRPLEEAVSLDENAPLLGVLTRLDSTPFLFVTTFGTVAGIVTRADMQKPPVRMWLFGMVTLIEMRFGELVERHCPGDSWRQYLSESRLQKAQLLLEERRRRNQALELTDCLQFADKAQIIARNEEVRKLTVFPSRRQAEEAAKRLEQLRNNLTHSQDILASDWGTIVQLCAFLNQQTP